jgi:hypothetical protein
MRYIVLKCDYCGKQLSMTEACLIEITIRRERAESEFDILRLELCASCECKFLEDLNKILPKEAMWEVTNERF